MESEVQVTGRFSGNTAQSLRKAALAGLGIALLPDYLCQDELASGRLLRVLPLWTPQTKFGSHIMAIGAPERIETAARKWP